VGVGPLGWDPLGHAVIAAEEDSAPHTGYRIVRADLDSLVKHGLFASQTEVLRRPRYSPDGSRIAYITQPLAGGDLHLCVAGRDGEAPRRVFARAIADGYSWGPDSKRISVVTYSPKDFSADGNQVWIVNVENGSYIQVTHGK